VRPEVRAAEVRHLGRRPPVQAVVAGQRLQDPRVHRKGFEPAGAEQEDAVRDLCADAGQFEQAGVRRGVGQGLSLLQPAGAVGEEPRGSGDVAGTEPQQAAAQLSLRYRRERGPVGQGVRTSWE